MGYNLSVGCHDCRVRCGSLRGEESVVIKRFDRWHYTLLGGRNGHRFEALIDNGFSSPEEFPREYRDVYEEVMGL